MKFSLPSGWSVGSTILWTFLVVFSAKIALWVADKFGPLLAQAASAAV